MMRPCWEFRTATGTKRPREDGGGGATGGSPGPGEAGGGMVKNVVMVSWGRAVGPDGAAAVRVNAMSHRKHKVCGGDAAVT
jgi:hypothetical protein